MRPYAPLAAAARTRADEIAAPLRALAGLAGGAWPSRLEASLAAAEPRVAVTVEELLRRALERVVGVQGCQAVAMPHLRLEMAASAPDAPLPSAETLGRMLLASGARREGDPTERRRLHGEVVRVYHLAPGCVAGLQGSDPPAAADPFAFCVGRTCEACRYASVCAVAWPGLQDRKRARGGAAVDGAG